MGSYKYLTYREDEGVAWITLNRPEVRNALNMELRGEIKQALREAAGSEKVKIIVVTGAGGNFCAGADLKEFMTMEAKDIEAYLDRYGTAVIARMIMDLDKLVIAAVDGFCMAGGLEIVEACDLAIATERARFGQTEVNVGLMPGGGGTQMLVRLIGLKRAKEMVATGKLIDAYEAERIGLVNKVVPAERLEEEVKGLCVQLLRKAPLTLKLIKKAVNYLTRKELEEGFKYEKELFIRCWLSEDRVEGIRAFLEKREPRYVGRDPLAER
ncbi:MAG: enoyl-CoA hydratase/isomerase family protein [Candidatus Nezhaarchaeales archaeon]